MTFLNPFLLVALAAAAVPLLLHLLNLRKLRTVEFSSLRFLKELQKTRIRRLKLRQLLLLLLRIGLVVFAVLAFARPALRGTSGLPGAHAATTAVILVDNSYSMQARDARGERFKQAQRAAADILELMGENDEVYLVPMTDLKSAAGAEPSRNREALKNAVEKLGLGYRRADLDDALRMAARLLDKSENLNKEVYVITDAQRANVRARSDSMKILGSGTRVYLMPIGDGDAHVGANLGVDSLHVLSSVFEIGKPVEVRAWIHNYGTEDVENVPVSMYLARERAAQGSVSVKAGATQTIDLSAAPKAPGFQSGYVELGTDALDADNRRSFAFPVLGPMRVVVASSSESASFLGLVFSTAGSALNVESVTPAALPSVNLAGVSAVVLADAGSADADRLARFVQDGGGLVIYGGPGLDRNAFNSGLGSALGIALGPPVTSAGTPLTFGSVEREHPIFSGVFDAANPGVVESPKILQAAPAAGGETVIALSNGSALLSEFRRGRGRIVYVAVPPSRAWSDLPLKAIFVPLATRTALYVGAHGDPFPRTVVGENITVPLPVRATLPDQVKVSGPDGREEFVPVRKFPSGASITYDRATAPGVYRVSAGAEDLALFTADMGSGESDLAMLSREQLRAAIAGVMVSPEGFAVLSPDRGDFATSIVQSRFGLELWKYMLALALVCAFAEMVVGRTPKADAGA